MFSALSLIVGRDVRAWVTARALQNTLACAGDQRLGQREDLCIRNDKREFLERTMVGLGDPDMVHGSLIPVEHLLPLNVGGVVDGKFAVAIRQQP